MASFIRTAVKNLLTRWKLSGLFKHLIAERVGNPAIYTVDADAGAVDADSLRRIKVITDLTREVAGRLHELSPSDKDWESIVEETFTMYENFEVFLRNVFDKMIEDERAFTKSHLYAMYTFLIDLTVHKLNKHQPVDVDQTLDVLHERIIEKKGVGFLTDSILALTEG